jgi:TolB-like protein/DNA-binding winged helix-turn-helix (wHTH) protein/Tfp pilus assembly protein PilF
LQRYVPGATIRREESSVKWDAARKSFLRFGVFELDLESGELRKAGVLIHLPPQPVKLLAFLAGRPGQLITREEIRQHVWGSETFVDSEQGLNHCIKQIRTALGDDAEAARYIQTLPRRGYRFIAPVDGSVAPVSSAVAEARPEESGAVAAGKRRWRLRPWMVATPLLAALGAAALLLLNGPGPLDRLLPNHSPPRIESIAVLPLANLSGDIEQEYLADGMTEELITTLGQTSALRVISRTSVMRYKGSKKQLPEIARELNVDAVVEGTLSRSGSRVLVTANLLHGPSDRHLWAQSYERDLDDVLVLQREIARTIVREIRAALPPKEQARQGNPRPLNPEAHELYLKGQYHYYKWTPPEFEKAVAYFEKAIAADPNYAEAYLGLAKTYGWQWIQGSLPPKDAYPKFSAALKRALEIDDTLPEAHYVLAVSAFYFYWNWGQAEAEFKRALALNPNMEEARFEYAWFLTSMGRFTEGIAEAKRAVKSDPLSVSANLALGSTYQSARQYDQAIAQCRKTIELEPDDFRAYEFLAGAYEDLGLYGEAVKADQKAMTLRGAKFAEVAALGEAYRVSGRAGRLQWTLARTKNPYRLAILQMRLGNKEEAFKNLEKSYLEHDWQMVQLKSIPEWDPLRSDPRFQSLLRRMNFPPA